MSDMNPNDVVESKRLKLANARAKKNYWKVEGPKVMKAYKKNRAEFDKKLAYENSPEGLRERSTPLTIDKVLKGKKKK
jgi:hypothetical protein